MRKPGRPLGYTGLRPRPDDSASYGRRHAPGPRFRDHQSRIHRDGLRRAMARFMGRRRLRPDSPQDARPYAATAGAPPARSATDALRGSERSQIKGRAYGENAKPGQRMSRVKTDSPCDTGDRPQARTSASLYRGQRIWFEAVSPGPGDPGHPDFITAPKSGEVADVPNERMVLRYLNSISEKYEHQYANWLANDHVSQSDAFVIALNPRRNGTPDLQRSRPTSIPTTQTST
jgi:hypothetical protein